MRKYLFLPAIFALASCVGNIEEHAPDVAPGNEVEVTVGWSVAGMEPGDEATRAAMDKALADTKTRTIPDDMKSGGAYSDLAPTVENMWIIQFDGNTPASKMLGVPRFISHEELPVLNAPNDYPLEISMPLVNISTAAYTLFVANIREGVDYKWGLTSESTFADVVTRVKYIANEGQSFEDFMPGKTLLMSAVVESPVQLGTDLTPVFKRNVAKVTLDLTLDPMAVAAGVEIVSVRMMGVQRSIVFADAALGLAKGITGTTKFPVDAALIDYAPEAAAMTAAGENKTFSWYVPRNQQGVVAASGTPGVKDKSGLAPRNATCLEISTVKKSSGNTVMTSVFRVYPGANMINDFNIESNHHYTVGLTVKEVGIDPADTRVLTYPVIVDYTGSGTPGSMSNSFIINPAPVGDMVRQYRIPIDQVNRYWGAENASLSGYGNTPFHVIGSDERWKIDLVWSDLDGLYSGPGSTGSAGGITLADNNGLGAGFGEGPNQYFVLNVPANLPAGNFVLGIKETSGGGDRYLWSWHFWVTDYNPNKFTKSNIRPDKYTYPVPGGQVERYGPPANTDITDPWTSTYADDVMMDRSLGAVETYFTSNVYSNDSPYRRRGILYYQYGRKDPLPATADLKPYKFATAPGPITIAESISFPWVLYTVDGGNWTSDVVDIYYLWNDPKAITGIGNEKSIYDPCPPGWRLPIHTVWADFPRKNPDGQFVNAHNAVRDLGWNYGRGIGNDVIVVVNGVNGVIEMNVVNGIRYWPGGQDGDPVEGRIWYPAVGRRHMKDGAINVGNYTYYHAANAASATSSRILYIDSGSVSTSGTGRAWASPVRCISE